MNFAKLSLQNIQSIKGRKRRKKKKKITEAPERALKIPCPDPVYLALTAYL